MGSSEFYVSVGRGHLSDDMRRAVEREGATLTNSYYAECNCGGGCRAYCCDCSQRHWIAVPNGHGQKAHAERVRAVMRTAATKQDRALLSWLFEDQQ